MIPRFMDRCTDVPREIVFSGDQIRYTIDPL